MHVIDFCAITEHGAHAKDTSYLCQGMALANSFKLAV